MRLYYLNQKIELEKKIMIILTTGEELYCKNIYLELATQIAADYFTEKKTLEEKQRSIRKNYTGDLLQSETQKVNGEILELKPKAIEAIKKEFSGLIESNEMLKVEYQKCKSKLGTEMISKDFEILKLPVKLTAEQLDTLADRNAANPLLIQALRQHAETNNVNVNGQRWNCLNAHDKVEIMDSAARAAIRNLCYAVQNDNPTFLSIFCKAGNMNIIDEFLEDDYKLTDLKTHLSQLNQSELDDFMLEVRKILDPEQADEHITEHIEGEGEQA